MQDLYLLKFFITNATLYVIMKIMVKIKIRNLNMGEKCVKTVVKSVQRIEITKQ